MAFLDETGLTELVTKLKSWVTGQGYTKNTGTITGIKMNGSNKGSSGVVDLGTVITEHQDISGKSDIGHKHTKSEITDFPTSMKPTVHNQASNTINAMTGYSKPTSTSNITTSDTLNSAIGKLEKALDEKSSTSHTHNYLPLTGGKVGNDDASISIKGTGITGDTNSILEKFDTVSTTKLETSYIALNSVDINSVFASTTHTHDEATTSSSGFMSDVDKQKLDGIASGANAYTHPTYTSRTGVPTSNQTPAFGGTFSITQPISNSTGHITAMNSRTITIPSTEASQSTHGLMSSEDKTKLDGIATGAQVNSITGVKGNAETAYRTGNVNITPDNIGAVSKQWTKLGEVTGTTSVSVSSNYSDVYVEVWVDGALYLAMNTIYPTTISGGRNIRMTGQSNINAILEIHSTYVKLIYVDNVGVDCTSTSKMLVYAR